MRRLRGQDHFFALRQGQLGFLLPGGLPLGLGAGCLLTNIFLKKRRDPKTARRTSPQPDDLAFQLPAAAFAPMAGEVAGAMAVGGPWVAHLAQSMLIKPAAKLAGYLAVSVLRY